jgi:hypothetical protein
VGLISIEGEEGQLLLDSIESVNQFFGEPEWVLAMYFDDYYLTFFNASKGIAYSYDAYPLKKSIREEISPEISINEFNFFDPNVFDYLLERGIFTSGIFTKEETLELMVPWNGYGNIKEIYNP